MPSSPSYNWNPISLWFLPPICEPLPQPNVTWDFPRRVNFFLHNSAIQHLKGHFSPLWYPIYPNLFEMFGLYFGKLCEDLVLDVWECRLYFLWLVMNSYLTSIRHLQIENFHLLRACPNFQPRCSFRGKSVWRRGRYSNVASFWTLIVSLRNISIPNRQNTLIWVKDKKFKGNQNTYLSRNGESVYKFGIDHVVCGDVLVSERVKGCEGFIWDFVGALNFFLKHCYYCVFDSLPPNFV